MRQFALINGSDSNISSNSWPPCVEQLIPQQSLIVNNFFFGISIRSYMRSDLNELKKRNAHELVI